MVQPEGFTPKPAQFRVKTNILVLHRRRRQLKVRIIPYRNRIFDGTFGGGAGWNPDLAKE